MKVLPDIIKPRLCCCSMTLLWSCFGINVTGVKHFRPTLVLMICSMHGLYFLILLRRSAVQRIYWLRWIESWGQKVSSLSTISDNVLVSVPHRFQQTSLIIYTQVIYLFTIDFKFHYWMIPIGMNKISFDYAAWWFEWRLVNLYCEHYIWSSIIWSYIYIYIYNLDKCSRKIVIFDLQLFVNFIELDIYFDQSMFHR